MKNTIPNENNLKLFLKDIKKEDKLELIHTYGEDFENIFIKTILEDIKDSDIYFLTHNFKPVAIGGAVKLKENPDVAQVWLLCTNNIQNHKLYLYKYIKSKIELFKKKYSILFNYIYKSNFSALLWLKKYGFKSIDLENEDFKFFYFSKGGHFDI